jgi:putative lipoprotein
MLLCRSGGTLVTARHRWILGTAALAALNAGADLAASSVRGQQPEQPSMVTGTVSYRQRIALTPTAALEVTLEDVSKADAPATVIASRRIENPGQVPIRFGLMYDVSRIAPNHTYHLRARIIDGGTLRFTSTHAYPVLTRGHGSTVDIEVQPVTLQTPPASGQTPPNAGDIEWKLVRLGKETLVAGSTRTVPSLRFRGSSVQGNAGCNTFRGGYDMRGSQLTFSGLLNTQMACPNMDIEKGFLMALGATASWRMSGSQLELLDKAGDVVAVFEGAAAK